MVRMTTFSSAAPTTTRCWNSMARRVLSWAPSLPAAAFQRQAFWFSDPRAALRSPNRAGSPCSQSPQPAFGRGAGAEGQPSRARAAGLELRPCRRPVPSRRVRPDCRYSEDDKSGGPRSSGCSVCSCLVARDRLLLQFHQQRLELAAVANGVEISVGLDAVDIGIAAANRSSKEIDRPAC